jgi:hypothetical protein
MYRPGETATLTVKTAAGGQAVAAGVGLMGVDLSLAQLAPLVGPDDWGRVTVRATADRPAFGSFDPRALTLGRVRGQNAARAAVMRISQLPMDHAGDARISASGSAEPDIDLQMVDNFYATFELLIAKVRAWEASAPAGETLQPATMVSLWNEALAERKKAGEPIVDGWGRELTLDLLARDLALQLDPLSVVADGTRLSEDVIPWNNWLETHL